MTGMHTSRVLARQGVVIGGVLAAAIIAFSVVSPYFGSARNLQGLIVQLAITTLLAAGMTFVLVGGGIDLSVGSVLGLSAATTLVALGRGVPLVVGIVVGLATGAVVGAINGAVITRLGINDLIATLATLSIVAGLLRVVTTRVAISGVDSRGFLFLAHGLIAGIPTPAFIVVGVVLALELVLVKTPLGRGLFASGLNRRAAHLSGISVASTRFWAYVLSGTAAGAAGVVLASRLNSVSPGLGAGYELTAIAAAVLGGVSLSGGRGRVWLAVLGAAFLAVLENGLRILGVDPLWFTIITGTCIVAAAAFDQEIRRLNTRWLSTEGAKPPGPGRALPAPTPTCPEHRSGGAVK